tara:strand:+ start:884 stop:1114 length:231 start_codon:yes stop_codon:yes gene_type:complete
MIYEAILKINPNAKAKVWGDDINTCEIEWLDNTTQISKEDIKAKLNAEAQEEIDNKTSATNKLKALGLTDAEIEAL